MSEQPERFNWESEPAIILQRRDVVAAYVNADGNITVLQQRYPDDDAVIVIPQQDAEYFASRDRTIRPLPTAGVTEFM